MTFVIASSNEPRPAEGGAPSGTSFKQLTVNDSGFQLVWEHTNDVRTLDGRWLSSEGSAHFSTAEEVAEVFGEEHRFTVAAREWSGADLEDLLARQERAEQRQRDALAEARRVFAQA